MSSYIRNIIGFFIFIYALLLPSTLMNAFAEDHLTTGGIYTKAENNKDNVDLFVNESSKKRIHDNTNETSKYGTPHFIARNLQTVGNILSSSPADLTEQAKSYALGKFNSTITSEVQKWLSQFGTARINFGLDKKGTLENNALELLLPLYDNKTDWLLFSQFGYRNKDSRNTINVGLGGRYFYQNWMYGLNTFYDHDLTGQNQRLGLGGEIWGDYIKLSANTYYRLSDWQHSQNFKDYHERPANGYDINGEFFLPAYPNLGAKLTYEQYFGDNVTLFNRDTKQKNPSLAKLGLTYTPIPLLTMGVDYKQGESGHTETQFLANFNYKLGVPLSTQLSPENVASMRTLAGSRYDLVDRNNNIVLDHIKQPIIQLSIPTTLTGYSHEEKTISVTNQPDNKINLQENKEFIKNGGKIVAQGNQVAITFPTYQFGNGETNNYPIHFNIFENSTAKNTSHNGIFTIIVRPFVVKEKEVNPTNTLPADGQKVYIFTPVITYDAVGNQPLAQVKFNNVQWTTEPKIDEKESGLQWGKPEKTTQTNDKGQLQAALMSSKPIKDVKVFLQMDGMPKTQVGTVSFGEDTSRFQIKTIEISPDNLTEPLTADGVQTYTYKAVVFDGNNNSVPPNTSIADIKWDHNHKAISTLKLVPNGDKTDSESQLTATLKSSEPVDNVIVTLSIEGHPEKSAKAVSFKSAQIQLTHTPSGPILVGEESTITAEIKGMDGQNRKGLHVNWTLSGDSPKVLKQDTTTDSDGKATMTLTSTVEQVITVKASINDSNPSQTEVDFKWPSIQDVTLSADTPNGTILPGGAYKFTATLFGADGRTHYTGTNIPFKWHIESPANPNNEGLSLSPAGEVKAVSDGILNAELTSTKDKPAVADAKICLTVVDAPQSPTTHKCVDSINFKSPPVDFEISSVEVYAVEVNGTEQPFDQKKPLLGNGADKYKYRALITKKGSKGQAKIPNHAFSDVEWTRNQTQIDYKYLPKPDRTSLKTDGDGYLYATLDSYVGVNDVTVTLTIPDELSGNNPKDKDAANQVSFEPVSKQAIMFIYNKNNLKKYRYFTTEYHPANVIPDIIIGKLGEDTSGPFDESNDDVYYDLNPDQNNFFPNIVKLGQDHKGPMIFTGPWGKATITAKVTKKDGRIYAYYYRINIKQTITYSFNYGIKSPPHRGYHTINDDTKCENYGGFITPRVEDFLKEGGEYQVDSEFDNLFDWGLFYGHEGDIDRFNPKKPIKYKLTSGGYPNFVIFNPLTETYSMDPNDIGFVICTYHYTNQDVKSL
ncbi:putative invasin [Xenorhabdus poinarii G6]|uniref:Putative invasin n=1 Tax=Xenorhabdus poinarii G6 TaxID=1354304 RepID=A0A068QYW1_9GAMM|nr:inverse autotransporter beta-barrel domain-containing protein [Xenorhabdus poinarii]CDG19836.1 putative invasin [Xenorhabdus poinarii G6]